MNTPVKIETACPRCYLRKGPEFSNKIEDRRRGFIEKPCTSLTDCIPTLRRTIDKIEKEIATGNRALVDLNRSLRACEEELSKQQHSGLVLPRGTR